MAEEITMKALKSFRGVEGKIRQGKEFKVATEDRARGLERSVPPLAVRVVLSGGAPLAVTKTNTAASRGPTSASGGRTGEAAQQSSSRVALVQPKSALKKPATKK